MNYNLAKQIREEYSTGNITQTELSKKYSVTIQNINRVITNIRWNNPYSNKQSPIITIRSPEEQLVIYAQIEDLLLKGHSQIQIHREIGATRTEVAKAAKKLGITGKNFLFFKELDARQEKILRGTLLGDGYTRYTHPTDNSNCFLGFTHCPDQKEYLRWKARQFGNLFLKGTGNSGVLSEPRLQKNGRYTITSKVHPILNPYRDLFYSRPDEECRTEKPEINKKKITWEILETIDHEAFAIWWCDDGSVNRPNSLTSRGALTLIVGAVPRVEQDMVAEWLRSKKYTVSSNYLEENLVVIRFSVDSSERLYSEIKDYVPECMQYKLNRLFTPKFMEID